MTTTQTYDWIPPGTFGPDDHSEQLELDLRDNRASTKATTRQLGIGRALKLTIELRFHKVC